MIKVSEFDYDLPAELIAQVPLLDRSSSKLLVVDRKSNSYTDHTFSDITSLIDENSCLVVNNTKVIPARIIGVKEETDAVIELLLLNEISDHTWLALVKPGKRVKIGTSINFGDKLRVTCIDIKEDGIREFKLFYEGILYEVLDELGTMPLPPYITEKLADKDRYQTVYAVNPGSVAAPTAGLHFTEEIISGLKLKGVKIVEVTLHVGLGTFKPMSVENIDDHIMHSEYYEISKESANILNECKKNGVNIISVGTTSTRVLETNFNKFGKFKEDFGYTDIFIYPGYEFKGIDSLITNFHLPKSTLLMLISAFSSKELMFSAYEHAIKNKYRFFSFGDAMYIK